MVERSYPEGATLTEGDLARILLGIIVADRKGEVDVFDSARDFLSKFDVRLRSRGVAQSDPEDQSLYNIADWLEQKGVGGSAKIVREAADTLHGVAQQPAYPVTSGLRQALQSIADWRKVNISGEYEHGLRDIIRSITECAAAALDAEPRPSDAAQETAPITSWEELQDALDEWAKANLPAESAGCITSWSDRIAEFLFSRMPNVAQGVPDSGALRQALDAIQTQCDEMRSLKGWRLNLIRENLAKAYGVLSSTPNESAQQPLAPCTQAELDTWEKYLDKKDAQLLLMWVDRALKAEAALAMPSTQPRTPPTIDDLEAILNSNDDRQVTINPDGTVTVSSTEGKP